MKTIFGIISIAILSFALGIFLPWWSIAIASFVISFVLVQKPLIGFLSGFVAIFLLWGLDAYLISNHNGHILANRMSQVILKKENPYLLIIITAIIGGLVAAFASLSGSFLRSLINQQRSN